MQKKYAALALGLTVVLSACGGGTPALPQDHLTGAVALGRAQEAVTGATVKVVGSDITATTDSKGEFALDVPRGTIALEITKPGFATTRVQGINTEQVKFVDEILRPAFDSTATVKPPQVSVKVVGTNAEGKETLSDLSSGLTVGSGDLTLKVDAVVDDPAQNTVKTAIASLEVVGGTSGQLNAGVTRQVFGDARGENVVTFKAADFAAFSGPVNLHLVVYDLNGNRTHVIYPITVKAEANTADVVAPTKLSPFALTFGDNVTFGAQSVQPAQANAELMQQVSSLGAPIPGLKTHLDPQAAPNDASLWVDLDFVYDGANLPRAFELLRSFDGKTFEKVMSAAPARIAISKEGDYRFRDTSSLLSAGKPVYYKVAAVSDTDRAESADAVTVTPLERYTVELQSPGQFDTGVDLVPIFRWTSQGRSDKTISRVLVLDRIQAEQSTTAWLSDPTAEETAVYNFDRSAAQPRLQPYHAYEWQVASVTINKEGTAAALAADYFNLFKLLPSPQVSVRSGPVHEFVTGGR